MRPRPLSQALSLFGGSKDETCARFLSLREADLCNLELQQRVPYQGRATSEEIDRALALLATGKYAGGVPCFPPVLEGILGPDLQAAVAVLGRFTLPLADAAQAVKAYRGFEERHIGALVAFSMPSLVPILLHMAGTMSEDDRFSTTALKWSADAAHYFKDYSTAEAAYEQLLEGSSARKSTDLVAHAHRGLGDCAIKSRRYEAALEHYRRAEKLYLKIGRSGSVPRTVRSIADAYRALGKEGRAIGLYKKAGNLAVDQKQVWNRSKTYQELGWTEWKRGGIELAIEAFWEALKLHKKLERSRGRFTCYFCLTRLTSLRRLDDACLRPTPDELDLATLLGHKPWEERPILLGLASAATVARSSK